MRYSNVIEGYEKGAGGAYQDDEPSLYSIRMTLDSNTLYYRSYWYIVQ